MQFTVRSGLSHEKAGPRRAIGRGNSGTVPSYGALWKALSGTHPNALLRLYFLLEKPVESMPTDRVFIRRLRFASRSCLKALGRRAVLMPLLAGLSRPQAWQLCPTLTTFTLKLLRSAALHGSAGIRASAAVPSSRPSARRKHTTRREAARTNAPRRPLRRPSRPPRCPDPLPAQEIPLRPRPSTSPRGPACPTASEIAPAALACASWPWRTRRTRRPT